MTDDKNTTADDVTPRKACGYSIFNADWQGISIQIRYCQHWPNGLIHDSGFSIAHLEVETMHRDPLPITNTGYVSHFRHHSEIEALGGAVEYVFAWLEHMAQETTWVIQAEVARQYSLF